MGNEDATETVRRTVAVITLHRVKNYGSVLQAYATQRLLEDLGHPVNVIDYWRPDLTDSIDDVVARSRWASHPLLRRLFRLVRAGWARRNQYVFNRFVEIYLNLTPKSYFSAEELVADPPLADVYCVGSDQVWNDDYNVGGSGPFFLEFAPEDANRIAFSASIGKTNLSSIEKELISNELPRFSAVSVRESSAVELLRQVGIESQHVLDPTLAVGTETWLELAPLDPSSKPRLLVYQLNKSAEFDRIVSRLEELRGAKAIRIRLKTVLPTTTRRVVQPTVPEFLSLFRNADYVVTDSFHGTAFSLNFQVPFTSVLPHKYSERISSILELTGLTDRIATDASDLDTSPIDWDDVGARLQASRERSQQFLLDALEIDDRGLATPRR